MEAAKLRHSFTPMLAPNHVARLSNLVIEAVYLRSIFKPSPTSTMPWSCVLLDFNLTLGRRQHHERVSRSQQKVQSTDRTTKHSICSIIGTHACISGVQKVYKPRKRRVAHRRICNMYLQVPGCSAPDLRSRPPLGRPLKMASITQQKTCCTTE